MNGITREQHDALGQLMGEVDAAVEERIADDETAKAVENLRRFIGDQSYTVNGVHGNGHLFVSINFQGRAWEAGTSRPPRSRSVLNAVDTWGGAWLTGSVGQIHTRCGRVTNELSACPTISAWVRNALAGRNQQENRVSERRREWIPAAA